MHTFAANIYKRNLWTQYYPTFNSILLFNHWKEYRSITIYRTRIMDLWCGKSRRYPYFLILSFTFLFNVIFRRGKVWLVFKTLKLISLVFQILLQPVHQVWCEITHNHNHPPIVPVHQPSRPSPPISVFPQISPKTIFGVIHLRGGPI